MNNWIQALANLFLPNNCIYCQEPVWGQNPILCNQCLNAIETVPQIYNEIYREKINPCHIDKVLVSFIYDSILQELLEKLKYDGQKEIGRYLGKLVYVKMQEELPENFIIVPIPLHKRKYKLRGFNQAQIISNGMQGKSGALAVNLLSRKKDTPTQTKLTKEERKENVKEAFKFNFSQYSTLNRENPIILLDDVLTSGATMNEAALELKNSGFKTVIGLAIATPIIKDFF